MRGDVPRMSLSPSLDALIEALRVLPGVGPKTAQRMAFYLIQRNRPGAQRLVRQLQVAIDTVRRCARCRNLSDTEVCAICTDPRREGRVLCVVETPADVAAIESAGGHRGGYFVLHGRLSPIDGVGPEALGINSLLALIAGASITEVILATNLTIEGEATAHYLAQELLPLDIAVTRIAHGVPIGGELEFLDASTVTGAITGRHPL